MMIGQQQERMESGLGSRGKMHMPYPVLYWVGSCILYFCFVLSSCWGNIVSIIIKHGFIQELLQYIYFSK